MQVEIVEKVKKYILLIIFVFIVGLFPYSYIAAQDCDKVHYEVNAGGDIEVCLGGVVSLDGIIGGDATHSIWRGGKGTFSLGRESLKVDYTPTESEVETGVVLILVADNPKLKCPPARSEMRIRVNGEIKADAGNDQRICQGNTVQLQGNIKGKAKKIMWITNGSGKFDNAHKLNAVYTPSKEDIKSGALSLQLNAEAFGLCLPDSDVMIIMIDKAPEFETTAEKYVKAGEPVSLSLQMKDPMGTAINWSSEGNGTFNYANKAEVVYKPSAEDASKGTLHIYASVSYASGKCSAKKQVTLHFTKKTE